MMNTVFRALDIFSQKDVIESKKIADIAIEVNTRGTSLLCSDNMQKCIENGYDSIMNNKEKIFKILNY